MRTTILLKNMRGSPPPDNFWAPTGVTIKVEWVWLQDHMAEYYPIFNKFTLFVKTTQNIGLSPPNYIIMNIKILKYLNKVFYS